MEPSETQRGQRWLSNFDPADQPSARLLLDSLEFIGQDELRSGLQKIARTISEQVPRPIALIPVRALSQGQQYYGSDRNAQPRLLLSGSLPGSEAIVANIITGLRRQDESLGPFVASPSLRNLREARCRSIAFIDDLCGSGERMRAFYEGVRKHPTLLSWKSYRLIQYHAVAYAMTQAARLRLTKFFGKDFVHPYRSCPSFDNQHWTKEEKERIEDICRRYANTRIAVNPLGYGEARALIVFSHCAPNNLPVILWQRDGPSTARWHPFFDDKAVPDEFGPLFGQPPNDKRATAGLKRLGQVRLAKGRWPRSTDSELKGHSSTCSRCPPTQ